MGLAMRNGSMWSNKTKTVLKKVRSGYLLSMSSFDRKKMILDDTQVLSCTIEAAENVQGHTVIFFYSSQFIF